MGSSSRAARGGLSPEAAAPSFRAAVRCVVMGLFRRKQSSDGPGPDLARCSICGKEHPVATMVTRHKEPEDVPSDAEPSFPEPSDWHLEDAESLNAEHPRSFFIPDRDRRLALRPGELVRLGFVYGPHADHEEEGHVERMWVEVLEQPDGGHAHGRLRNTPARFTALRIGDHVAFEPEHVLGIDYSDEELGYAQDQWPLVDRAVLDDDRPPDVVIRAEGPYVAGQDEWWLLLRTGAAGPATEGIGSLTDRFPGLEEPFRAGDGVWELAGGEAADARWRRVGEDELAADEWQRLFAWLAETAEHLRGDQSS